MKLPNEFYFNPDPVVVAKDLLGKILVTNTKGEITSGIIVETEAYMGATDRASHAYPNKRTNRNSIMFEKGGASYVYLIYGIYHLFNVVTSPEGSPNAVLIRALEPVAGIDVMKRRSGRISDKRITSGPGLLSKALGIDLSFYAKSLLGEKVWIETPEPNEKIGEIIETTRIGVDYAGEDSLLPWRFYMKNNPWISKK